MQNHTQAREPKRIRVGPERKGAKEIHCNRSKGPEVIFLRFKFVKLFNLNMYFMPLNMYAHYSKFILCKSEFIK